MRVVILDGGQGARAYPFTEYLPTPKTPVHGKPMLVRVMECFADHWPNAGFSTMQSGVFDARAGDSLKHDVLSAVTRQDERYSYRQDTFFKSIDTHKGQQQRNDFFSRGEMPLRQASVKPVADNPLIALNPAAVMARCFNALTNRSTGL